MDSFVLILIALLISYLMFDWKYTLILFSIALVVSIFMHIFDCNILFKVESKKLGVLIKLLFGKE